ncbi:MAG: acetate--CoA ligase family protein [Candidatus Shapirobacteria bacterium]
MKTDLKGMFEPKSIAVIGASREPTKVGAIVLKNTIMSGYSGKIYPINPKIESVGNLKFYKRINDLPEIPDLLIVAIPAKIANSVIEEAGKFGIKNAVIFSAGYKEEGQEGKVLEDELKNVAEKYNINILGPNCLGFNNKSFSLNATFGQDIKNKGNLRIISQSGAIATALVDWGETINLGIDQLITLGNKAVVNENDILNYWNDGKYHPTGLYLESISDGKKLVEILKNYTKNNPVFILKPGKSNGAIKAMMSHTGAIAGEDSILNEAITESGAVRCEELSDFFDLCMAFKTSKLPAGNRVAVVTNAGGPAVLTTDTIEKYGLKLAEISPETKAKLDDCLPRMASFMNPVDVLGDSLAARFGEALEIVLQEKNVDAVVAVLTPQLMTEIEKTAEIISFLSEKYSQPIFCSFIGGSKVAEGEKIFNEKNIANFDYPERAIYCLAKMFDWKNKTLPIDSISPSPSLTRGGQEFIDIKKIIDEAKNNNQKVLNNFQSNQLMEMLGLATPLTEKVAGVAEAIEFSRKNGWPLVLKISGGDVLHKSELGGVMVDIRSEYKLKKSFEKMNRPDFEMQIQQQIEGGIEVILGIKRDPNFGSVLLFGAGGKMAELIKDRNLRLLPLTENKVESMINESKVYTLLNGFRNDKVYELTDLKKIIFSMEKLMSEVLEIEEIEINPAIITHDKTYCVDVKIKIK